MALQKKIPYKVLLKKLIASPKLTEAERKAFIEILKSLLQGSTLVRHQELWIETLAKKYF
jgi:hypothetical protein